MLGDDQELAHFLVDAKQRTYAAADNNTSVQPILPGSVQLEYRSGDYVYRDIYFGSAFFAGQEIVEYKNRPIWSMVYSGGTVVSDADTDDTRSIYGFLREALRLVDAASLFRGPSLYKREPYQYQNEFAGSLREFSGKELIFKGDHRVYELHYSGGMIR
ncbi:DUF5680 domain-containing protein [Paenibacillus sp. chi10]|uniref:DUF5680 domain-containing protein n=1 Tax=Paenibacillus suaedae TaxID=3077233 RepID=A0AAJ2JVT6_9BACL|nr:DUF5680 domain-containing protein [Paenibacillus sp. chi10]MDT8975128.1 DUF5680 domain-containing protein [Paenibacillus sp. chi10]